MPPIHRWTRGRREEEVLPKDADNLLVPDDIVGYPGSAISRDRVFLHSGVSGVSGVVHGSFTIPVPHLSTTDNTFSSSGPGIPYAFGPENRKEAQDTPESLARAIEYHKNALAKLEAQFEEELPSKEEKPLRRKLDVRKVEP